MAIKIGIGKLTLSVPLDQFVAFQVSQSGLLPLFVTYEHAYHVRILPQHHADPFDRLLIAQAVVENLVLLTVDPKIAPYGVRTFW